jgi:hypothetical protein
MDFTIEILEQKNEWNVGGFTLVFANPRNNSPRATLGLSNQLSWKDAI